MAKISERLVWVKWWKINQDGFYNSIPRNKLISLQDLAATYRGEHVLDIFRRGLIGEFRVTISPVKPNFGFATHF